ncbi:MAG: hypothetical protein ACSLE4_03230 [Methyloceanibacter sp.]|uniref:hypothetical protein n=1 Tax=Methyloceanibacter sp. TaxID=1965321 RepID=UPI003EDEF0C6
MPVINIPASLRRLSWLLNASSVEAAFRQLVCAVEAKFDPNQPRVPAGNPDGGQWTDAGGGRASGSAESYQSAIGGSADVAGIIAFARRQRLAGNPLNFQKCLYLCYPLLERRQRAGSDRNTWDFHKCMNACLQRNL